LTPKGVQPVCPFQQVFEYTFLFGAFYPLTGKQFQLEMSCCNTVTFQVFLNEFSQTNPQEYKIVILVNGAFHKAKRLNIPPKIALLFLPPFSP
jgi:hypothetical protein